MGSKEFYEGALLIVTNGCVESVPGDVVKAVLNFFERLRGLDTEGEHARVGAWKEADGAKRSGRG